MSNITIGDVVVVPEPMVFSLKKESCRCLLHILSADKYDAQGLGAYKFPNPHKEHILQLNPQRTEIRLEWAPEDLVHSICRLVQDRRNGVPEIMITRNS